MEAPRLSKEAEGNIVNGVNGQAFTSTRGRRPDRALHVDESATFEISDAPRPLLAWGSGYARRGDKPRDADGVGEVGSGHSTVEAG